MSGASTRSLMSSSARSFRRIDLAHRDKNGPVTDAATKKVPVPFDLDDDLVEEDSISPTLDWRLDPEESLSDWTIIVSDGTESFTYHVHKNVLGVGPRSSKYFSTLFHTQCETLEMASSTSNIILEPPAVEAFPVLLDYIYSGEAAIEITTGNAVALRFLTKYFGVRSLYVMATEHIRQTLTPKRGPIYLAEAGYYNDDRLIDAAARVCAENMEHIYVGLFASLPPELFRRVVLSSRLQCGSTWLSKTVAKYCRSNPRDVDPQFLLDVTDEALMPTVIAEEAPFLLCMCLAAEEALLGGGNGAEGDKGGQRAGADAAGGSGSTKTTADQLSSLRQRCIDACSLGWNDHLARPLSLEDAANEGIDLVDRRLSAEGSVRSSREIWHRNLPLPMQVELLEAALVRAREDAETADGRTAAGSMRKFKSKDDEVRDLRDALAKKDRELYELHKSVRALKGSKGRKTTAGPTDR